MTDIHRLYPVLHTASPLRSFIYASTKPDTMTVNAYVCNKAVVITIIIACKNGAGKIHSKLNPNFSKGLHPLIFLDCSSDYLTAKTCVTLFT